MIEDEKIIYHIDISKQNMMLTVEDLLYRCNKGEIDRLSIVAITKDDEILSALSGDENSPFAFIGALEMQKIELLSEID